MVSCGELRLVDVARPDPEVETMDAEAALRTLVTLDTWLEQGVMEVRHTRKLCLMKFDDEECIKKPASLLKASFDVYYY